MFGRHFFEKLGAVPSVLKTSKQLIYNRSHLRLSAGPLVQPKASAMMIRGVADQFRAVLQIQVCMFEVRGKIPTAFSGVREHVFGIRRRLAGDDLRFDAMPLEGDLNDADKVFHYRFRLWVLLNVNQFDGILAGFDPLHFYASVAAANEKEKCKGD